MEYSLKINGEKVDVVRLKVYLEKQQLEFCDSVKYIDSKVVEEIILDIGLSISIFANILPTNHPGYAYETMFLEEDFEYQETVSFDLNPSGDYETAYRIMYEICFAILEMFEAQGILHHVSGEEMFLYKDGQFLFNESYMKWLNENYRGLLQDRQSNIHIHLPSNKELEKALDEDTITNEVLALCMQNHSYRIVVMAMFKAIERNYCDQGIIERLSELSVRLEDHKFIGPWQIGHVALATLALLDNQHANDKFNELHGRLNEQDRFLVQHSLTLKCIKIKRADCQTRREPCHVSIQYRHLYGGRAKY